MANDPATSSTSSDNRKVERAPNPARPVFYVNNTVIENSQVDVQLYFSFVHEITPGKFASVEQGLVYGSRARAPTSQSAAEKLGSL